MSKTFDVSKLTPLPDYVVNALSKTQRPRQVPSQQTLIVDNEPQQGLSLPILTPLPPITDLPTTVQVQPVPDRISQPPPGTIQLPEIQQTQPTELNPRPIPTSLNGPASQTTLKALTPLPPISTVSTITTVETSPNTEHKFTQELQLAPLSPRSPRIERQAPPTVVTHPVEPTQTETCCICYDTEIPTTNLLTCQHPVCGECTAQLRTPKCPMCQQFLEGPLVTDTILADIMNREEQQRLNDITSNYLAGLYLEEHPDANPEEVYDRYRN